MTDPRTPGADRPAAVPADPHPDAPADPPPAVLAEAGPVRADRPGSDVDSEPNPAEQPAGAAPVDPAAGSASSGLASSGSASSGRSGTAPAVQEPVVQDLGAAPTGPDAAGSSPAPWRRLSSAGALIWVLIALFGFTLVVQLRSNDADQGLATARQEDLVRILSDLEAREERLANEITTLEASQRQLTSGVQGRRVALAEAQKRANELGLLAGTLQAHGPGLEITLRAGGTPITASAILNTVQELRGAGGEVMQLAGATGSAVRVVASTSFVDSGDVLLVDGVRLLGPYLLTVIGDPQTMKTALNIPGGVVASVGNAGGTVNAQERTEVEVTAVRRASSLQYARPVS